MFVRVATISTTGVSPEQGIAFFRERVLPDLRSYAGFQDAMLLTSRDDEEALVLSFWDTEESLRQAEATPAPHRTGMAREALGPQTQRAVRVYQVAFRAAESGQRLNP
jgi:heme-degrading monooxygenase HmoA